MKRILIIGLLVFSCVGLYGQKYTALPVVTSATSTSGIIVRSGATGNQLSGITKENFLSDYAKESVVLDTVSDVVPLLADTSLVASFTIGLGNATDTACFTLNDVIAGLKWGGSHSLVITKVTAVVAGTTPDIDLALLYDANFKDGTPTEVFSSDLTVTSTTAGNDATINASNDTIADGVWLWFRVDQTTAQPTQCVINIYGYLE